MSTGFTLDSVPLARGADGVIRVGGTRVALDTVVNAFGDGATAEEIVQQYPSVALADVYEVIAYYLRHQQAVDAYIDGRRKESDRVRRETESRFDPVGVRDRLLARRASREP